MSFDKLRAALELKERTLTDDAEWNTQILAEREAHARLKPLFEAMLKVCEAADGIKYKLDHNSSLPLQEALNELKAVVAGEGTNGR